MSSIEARQALEAAKAHAENCLLTSCFIHTLAQQDLADPGRNSLTVCARLRWRGRTNSSISPFRSQGSSWKRFAGRPCSAARTDCPLRATNGALSGRP